jgi:hypothetical protein
MGKETFLWITDLQVSGFSPFRVLVFLLVPLSDPWFCESQTYKYLGFPSSGSRILARSVLYIFSPHNFPYKGVHLGWVDCGHKSPFSTIMKVGGGTTVYMCGRCIVFTPVTFWPKFCMAERFPFKVTAISPCVSQLFVMSSSQKSSLVLWYICNLPCLYPRYLPWHLICLSLLSALISVICLSSDTSFYQTSALVSVACLSSDMSSLDTTLFQSSFCHLTFIYF